MKSKMNTWTAIFNIFNCIMLFASWFVVFDQALTTGDADASIFYVLSWAGVALNVIALYYAKELNISLVGPILGIIGSAIAGISLLLAFPSIVLLIIAVVFEFLQKPANNNATVNANVQPWYKVWWIWVVVAAAVILSIIIVQSESSKDNDSSYDENSVVSTTKKVTKSVSDAASSATSSSDSDDKVLNKQYKVGQTINYKGYKVTVNDVKYDGGSEFDTPKSGNKYVAINVTIQNDTNDKQDYNEFDFKLSANGNGTDLDETTGNDTYDDNTIDSGTLDKGAKVTGYLIGQANPSAKLKLQYQPDYFDDQTLDIDLN